MLREIDIKNSRLGSSHRYRKEEIAYCFMLDGQAVSLYSDNKFSHEREDIHYCLYKENMDIYQLLKDEFDLQSGIYFNMYLHNCLGLPLGELTDTLYRSGLDLDDHEKMSWYLNRYLTCYRRISLISDAEKLLGFELYGLKNEALRTMHELIKNEEDNNILRVLMSKRKQHYGNELRDNFRLFEFLPDSLAVLDRMVESNSFVQYAKSWIQTRKEPYTAFMPDWSLKELEKNELIVQFYHIFGQIHILMNASTNMSECLLLGE